MSDAVLVAIIAAIPGTVAAILSYGNKLQGSKLINKTAEIHSLTNSNLTAVKVALANAEAKIDRLEAALEIHQKENI